MEERRKRPAGDVEGRYYRGKVRATQITLFEASCVPPRRARLPMLQGVLVLLQSPWKGRITVLLALMKLIRRLMLS